MEYPRSKLPQVGTTIFTVMSQLAAQHQAINLSQGFPDFDGPQALLDRVTHYLNSGANQYAPMIGVEPLREAICEKIASLYGVMYDPTTEVTVTSGATEALFAAISAVVRPGDEVIVFDPAYDSYEPAITLNGGHTIHLPLIGPQFKVDFNQLKDVLTDNTRLLIINTPHNPTGAVMSAEELALLAEVLADTDVMLLSDEVYEHIVFDGRAHASPMQNPLLSERTMVVSSFGKTYHTTGWKVGYCVAPASLMSEFRKVHQYLTFSTTTPMQFALADFMRSTPEHHLSLPNFYQEKRDLFARLLKPSRFKFKPSAATYFQLVDYSAISELPDTEFCEWLIKEVGVAAIPISVFYQQAKPQSLIRFCFAKNEQTLQQAAERLCEI